MEIIKTAIEGVVIIESRLFKDDRGYFFESFSQREFTEKVRKVDFVQDNESKSSYGVYVAFIFRNHLMPRVNWYVSLKALSLMWLSISVKAHQHLESMYRWN